MEQNDGFKLVMIKPTMTRFSKDFKSTLGVFTSVHNVHKLVL